jgi:type IV secretion system protein VirB11
MLIDVVVQFGVERHERYVRDIWYEPSRKYSYLASAR